MNRMSALVVFYSRSGHTRRVAREIAEAGDWDVLEIRDEVERSGLRGYLRSMLEAVLTLRPEIQPVERVIGDYELVVVGAPVWGMSLASPARAFIARHRRVLRDVAFFATCGGRGAKRALAQMETAAGRSAIATLALTERELRRGRDEEKTHAFVDSLERWRAAGKPWRAPPAETGAERVTH